MRAVCFFLVQLQGRAHILSSGGQCARHPSLDECDCELLFLPYLYQSLINKIAFLHVTIAMLSFVYLECFSLLSASCTINDHHLLVSWYVPDWQPCTCLQLFIGAMYAVSSSLGVFARVLVSRQQFLVGRKFPEGAKLPLPSSRVECTRLVG